MGEKAHEWSACDGGFLLGVGFVAPPKRRTQAEQLHYPCSVCDKGSRQSPALLQQQTVHIAEKPYVCNVGDKGLELSPPPASEASEMAGPDRKL